MRIRRVLFLAAAIWELIRFLLLVLAVWITFRQVLETNRQGFHWLLVLGNGTLLSAAALLFLFADPQRFRVLLHLVRLAKALGLLSSILLIILEPVRGGLRFLSAGFLRYTVAPFSILLIVCLADLILLFLLFSRSDGKQMLNRTGVR